MSLLSSIAVILGLNFIGSEINTNFLKENNFFLYVILNYVKFYFCFYAWIKYILHEKYVRTFSFVYNKKKNRYIMFL